MGIVVTGGAGFIGSALVHQLIEDDRYSVILIDKLTYAANQDLVDYVRGNAQCSFHQLDICDVSGLKAVFEKHRPTGVLHLAAESHVDRSIEGPADFVQTNAVGTSNLLDVSLRYWQELKNDSRSRFRFLHVSTDEVYGSLGPQGFFTEGSPYRPNSPYAASKAASDHFVRAWHTTYGLPTIVTNCANNYGPYQFPEKLIPLIIVKALRGDPIPLYGEGDYVRDWIHVDDHSRALRHVYKEGVAGETYLIGGRSERTNLEVARQVCGILDEMCPQSPHIPHAQLIAFVDDRPGHDRRYAIDCRKVEQELKWSPVESFETGLAKTVRWYLDHPDWWEGIFASRYRGERLGLDTSAATVSAP
ncbi:MAG: dTDP-glucose 4,6-dehydratase [Rhodospirillales bacterium]|nr:dTDP-glucose 4,6-dehydratase [Rhodospirillales bacterium]